MNSDSLGDIALVWSWEAFLSAGLFGLAFGWIGMTWLTHRRRWRPLVAPGVYALLVAFAASAFLIGLSLTQIVVSLDDPAWVRIVSRIGPNLTAAAAAGAGVWLALRGFNHSKGGPRG